MAGEVYARVKSTFFDRELVLAKTDRALIQKLSRAGAFIRRRAKSSIRSRKGISPAGSPPYSHVGTLRNAILFAYDASRKSVVIGPVQFGKSGAGAHALEYGGGQVVRTPRGRPLRKGRTLNYGARPYMHPALMAELPGIIQSMKGMVR